MKIEAVQFVQMNQFRLKGFQLLNELLGSLAAVETGSIRKAGHEEMLFFIQKNGNPINREAKTLTMPNLWTGADTVGDGTAFGMPFGVAEKHLVAGFLSGLIKL